MPKTAAKVTKLVHASTKLLMEELHRRQERVADTVAATIDEYWKRLAVAIAEKVAPDQLIVATKMAHAQMAKDLRKSFAKELDGLLDYTHQRAVVNVLAALPEEWVEDMLKRAVLPEKVPSSATAQKKSLKTAIFSSRQVNPGQVVKEVISDTTHLGNPQDIANTINLMRFQGKTNQQIARAIKPQVYGVKSTVRRVVRDTSQFAASAENVGTWNKLRVQSGGDYIIGYEIHAVPRTKYSRPEHLKRSGTVYYFTPKEGQEPMSASPLPPYDRINGEMVLQHNCRCWLSPVFAVQYQPVRKVA